MLKHYAIPMHDDDTNNSDRICVVFARDEKDASKQAVDRWAGPWNVHWDEIREATPQEVEDYYRTRNALRYSDQRFHDLSLDLNDIERRGIYEGDKTVTQWNKDHYRVDAMKKALLKAYEEGWRQARSEDPFQDNYMERERFYNSLEPYGDYD